MKPRPVTKLNKRNTTMSKNFDDDVMSEDCDVIFFFLINGQFGVIEKSDSERMVYKTYILNKSNFLSYKTSKQN